MPESSKSTLRDKLTEAIDGIDRRPPLPEAGKTFIIHGGDFTGATIVIGDNIRIAPQPARAPRPAGARSHALARMAADRRPPMPQMFRKPSVASDTDPGRPSVAPATHGLRNRPPRKPIFLLENNGIPVNPASSRLFPDFLNPCVALQ